jgi:hypothetical protein
MNNYKRKKVVHIVPHVREDEFVSFFDMFFLLPMNAT